MAAAKQKRTIPRENMYPIEVEIGKRKELGGPESTACFHLPLELQLDCPEAKTCGCQSSILSVTVSLQMCALLQEPAIPDPRCGLP